MKVTDFKPGDVICNAVRGREYSITITKNGFLEFREGMAAYLSIQELASYSWEIYEEPRKKETWYRFEYKVKGDGPVSDREWFKCRDEYIREFNSGTKFDIEPRVYEEKEF